MSKLNTNDKKNCLFLNLLLLASITLSIFPATRLGELIPFLGLLLSQEGNLAVYPALLFSFYILYLKIKEHRVSEYKPLFIFFCAYIIINLVIQIHALVIFDYKEFAIYEQLDGAIGIIYSIVSRTFRDSSNYFCFSIAAISKSFILLFSNCVFFFLPAYSIYLYLKDIDFNIFDFIYKAIIVSVGIIFLYVLIEVLSQLGSNQMTNILKVINPLLYEVEQNSTWWPPLLWTKGLRAVFQEPSYFSYYISIILPIFFYKLYNRKYINIIPLLFLYFCAFATNARSGSMLVLGETIVFIILWTILIRKNIISIVILCGILALSLLLGSSFIDLADKKILSSRTTTTEKISQTATSDNEEPTKSVVTSYLDNTVMTLTSDSARSNRSRFGLMKARIRIGLDHPILGVGTDLIGYHMINNLDDNAMKSNEVKTWISRQQERGSLLSVFPDLDFYSSNFASGGIIGLLIYCFPLLFILCKNISNLIYAIRNKREKILPVIILVCLSGYFAFGLSDILEKNYMYFIMLGVMGSLSFNTRANNGKKGKCK